LRIQVGSRLFRVGATEDHIVARVLCDMKDSDLLPAEAEDPVIVKKIAAFKIEASADSCQSLLRWSERHTHNETDEHLEEASRNLFGLIENTLLLKGEDATLRLRQLHDQIMVLRGAAFNGFIGFSLCLFAWVGARRNEKQPSWLRLALAFIPVVYFAVALRAICNHYHELSPSDPPYMEFTFFLLVLAAVWLIWLPRKKVQPPKGNETNTPETAAKQEKKKKKAYWQVEHCPRLIVVSAFLTIATFFGWWSTELAYAQRVVYTYESQSKAAVSPQK
ncbi:MAG: hypothetical protein DMG79_09680, partial [Acidobacteria bacterium]